MADYYGGREALASQKFWIFFYNMYFYFFIIDIRYFYFILL